MRFGRSILSFLAAMALSTAAMAQTVILQGGPTTPGHAPMYVGQGSQQPVVQDSGPAGGGAVGLGLSEILSVVRGTGTAPYANAGTGPNGENICDYDAPTTNSTGYHYLCLSPNAQGGGLLSYGAAGGATPLPLQFLVNGVPQNLTLSAASPLVITSGVISLTTVPVTLGGTGALSFTSNAPLIGNGTNAIAVGTRTGTTTAFATSTGSLTNGDCVSISSGNFVDAGGPCTTGGGSGTVTAGTTNQLAYYPGSAATVAGLATANNGVLITSGAGAPSISSTLPAAVQANITATGTVASGVWSGTAITTAKGGTHLTSSGSANNLLVSDGTDWQSYTLGNGLTVSGTTVLANLGSGLTFSTGAITASGTIGSVTIQKFTASGTYTPNAKMLYAIVQCVGGGGGGGGAANAAAGSAVGAGGGGGGSLSIKRVSASDIGASKAVTIGAAGTGGSAGNNAGAAGGDTSLGALCIGKGGASGSGANGSNLGAFGAGGVAGTGDVTTVGNAGGDGWQAAATNIIAKVGAGGAGPFGGAPANRSVVASTAGAAGQGFGAGGNGGISFNGGGTAAGGAGSAGLVIVTEFNSP